jgi:transposase
VVFDCQESRSGEHARHFPSGWKDHLMVDNHGGYNALFGEAVIELGCLAHARRKFLDPHQAKGNPIAQVAVRRIGELYAIEARGRSLTVEERQRPRLREAKPGLDALFAWLIEARVKIAHGSGTAQAMDDTLKRRGSLRQCSSSCRQVSSSSRASGSGSRTARGGGTSCLGTSTRRPARRCSRMS